MHVSEWKCNCLIELFGFFLILNCMSYLYFLDINPLSGISFANIFFHPVDCLFIFWWFPLLDRSFQVKLSPTCLFLLLFSLPDDADLKDLLLRRIFLKKVQLLNTKYLCSCLLRCQSYLSRKIKRVNTCIDGKESACQCRRHRFSPWVGKMPWTRKWQPTLVFLPGEFHGQKNLVGYNPWGRKELDTTESLTHMATTSPCCQRNFWGQRQSSVVITTTLWCIHSQDFTQKPSS